MIKIVCCYREKKLQIFTTILLISLSSLSNSRLDREKDRYEWAIAAVEAYPTANLLNKAYAIDVGSCLLVEIPLKYLN